MAAIRVPMDERIKSNLWVCAYWPSSLAELGAEQSAVVVWLKTICVIIILVFIVQCHRSCVRIGAIRWRIFVFLLFFLFLCTARLLISYPLHSKTVNVRLNVFHYRVRSDKCSSYSSKYSYANAWNNYVCLSCGPTILLLLSIYPFFLNFI